METFKCECCQLDHPNTLRPSMFEEYVPPIRCRMCNGHHGNALRRAEDHEAQLRLRLRLAMKSAREAHTRADGMMQRMKSAFASRDRTLRIVDRVMNLHEADRSGGCLCGIRNCPTLRVVSDDWILNRLADMHERETG